MTSRKLHKKSRIAPALILLHSKVGVIRVPFHRLDAYYLEQDIGISWIYLDIGKRGSIRKLFFRIWIAGLSKDIG
jgi:hypothetical protein